MYCIVWAKKQGRQPCVMRRLPNISTGIKAEQSDKILQHNSAQVKAGVIKQPASCSGHADEVRCKLIPNRQMP